MTDQDQESFLRWQDIAIKQLGYTINLMLTLAGAALGFGVKTMMESTTVLPCPARLFFRISLGLLAVSIVSAVGANFTRCHDYRYTRRAARARVKENEQIHDSSAETAEKYGQWTWGFFSLQSIAFASGVLLLALAIWLGFWHKI